MSGIPSDIARSRSLATLTPSRTSARWGPKPLHGMTVRKIGFLACCRLLFKEAFAFEDVGHELSNAGFAGFGLLGGGEMIDVGALAAGS